MIQKNGFEDLENWKIPFVPATLRLLQVTPKVPTLWIVSQFNY